MGISLVIILVGGRTYFSRQKEKNRQEQIKMMEELSRQQMEDDKKRSEEQLQNLMNEQKADLDKMQQSLDSVGENLKASKARFDSMVNAQK